MKLNRKNTMRQKAIRDALASGKAIGSLLVGLAALTGCRGRFPPHVVMGDVPMTAPENAPQETGANVEAPDGNAPGECVEQTAANAVNETTEKPAGHEAPEPVIRGKIAPPRPKDESAE